MLVFPQAQVRYLTGFTGSAGLVVVGRGSASLLTDYRYVLQAKDEARGVRVVAAPGGLIEELARRRLMRGMHRVGFGSEDITHGMYRALTGALRGIRLIPARRLIEEQMEVKSESELRHIRKACRISEEVFREILPLLRPGIAECEIAAEITFRQRCHGAEGDAFEPIVAAGTRGAFPHARATTRRLKRGELVTMDFGCTVAGYHSDITRTVALGRVPARLRQLYAAVLAAHDAAVAEARAGLDARALDAVARRVLAAAGLGKAFLHSLGHGLGLQLHERPIVSFRSTGRLRAGSVVTIEPGVYLARTGGVRIESDILLREQGCEMLTSPPGALMEL
jgi:Xaa-Pro aminopeptidase